MEDEEENLEHAVTRFNATALGVLLGLLAGAGLFLATNFLVLKGGAIVGPHLALLAQFFPGYRVTFLGSLIGFGYAFCVGFAIGVVFALLYNKIASA